MAKVTVDESTCTGCGLCESSCPEIFKVQDDGLAYVIAGDCSEGHNLQEISEQCPVEAIKVG